jgi:hypothetical protein
MEVTQNQDQSSFILANHSARFFPRSNSFSLYMLRDSGAIFVLRDFWYCVILNRRDFFLARFSFCENFGRKILWPA